MNLKKFIKPAGMFVGSLVVINVGIYFVLQMTTPKIGPRADMAELSADSLQTDSLQAANALSDSLLAESKTEEMNTADTVTTEESEVPFIEEPNVAEAISPPQIEEFSGETVEAGLGYDIESLSDAPRREAENAVQAMKEGDLKEIAKLAKFLESMKPADAAAIATQLDTDQIIVLMMRMKDRTAGKMLSELPVDQAARIASRMSQTASRARSGS